MAFDDLYQEIILDHYRHPRNSADLSGISDEHVHENPTCGDSVKLDVTVRDGKVESVRFDGSGCAISMASVSMMSELITGKSVEEAKDLIQRFTGIMRGDSDPTELEQYGDLAALSGVISYPLRIKCATLAWHALDSLIEEQ